MTVEDTKDSAISFSSKTKTKKVIKLEEEIAHWDSVLDRIQKVMPEDMRVYDHVVQARDAAFRLQQAMRGCEIVEFATSGLDDMAYSESIADLFWD